MLLAGEGTEQLDPSQAAKIFEGQLASALVAEDGQLALSNLAQSAAHAVMPKLQTQGQLGQARSVLLCSLYWHLQSYSVSCKRDVLKIQKLQLPTSCVYCLPAARAFRDFSCRGVGILMVEAFEEFGVGGVCS